jgi:ABC-type Zn uptake system ZnuABC Zn-binding protein ZnuA/ABC-type Mn2+/Zn2+ transport system permease subunit
MFALLEPFVHRGIAEILLLSVAAGIIGTWVILRGLAFFSHAAGTAAFPGLVLADGLGFAAPLGALGAAGVFAILLTASPRRRGDDRSAEIALILVGMLALGVILASDVFESSSRIESLLFGSLLLIDSADLWIAGATAAGALAATILAGHRWLATGFAGGADAAPGLRGLDLGLLVLIGVAAAAAITVVGALLVAALFVIPAATTRLFIHRLRAWQAASIALCAAEGTAGVLIAVELNAPPGAVIATLAGGVFCLAAIARAAGVRRSATAGLALTAVLIAGGCGAGDGARIVATTPIASDLTRSVAGEEVAVATIISPGTDPHAYEPRPDDIVALADADLVVASGGDIDAWIGEAMNDAGSQAELLVLGDPLPHPLPGDDPHWWHDPRNAAQAAARIGTALARLELEGAPDPARSGFEFAQRIGEADDEIAACIRALDPADRKLVTDHDAFSYLAARYDLEIVGAVIPALTTEAQASAGELADLRETIEREDVPAVFPEASVSGDLAATIARETGASADHELYGDSLGPEDSPAGTYLGMIRSNADELVRGLSGGERGCP